MPAEHMEALLHYAYDVFFRHEGSPRVLAVVSRSGNVVLFDRDRETCHVLPLAELQTRPCGCTAAGSANRHQSQRAPISP